MGGRWVGSGEPAAEACCHGVWIAEPMWMMGALVLMAQALWWLGWLWGGLICVLLAVGYVALILLLQRRPMRMFHQPFCQSAVQELPYMHCAQLACF